MGAGASRKKPPVVLDDADDNALFNAAFTNKVLNSCYLDTHEIRQRLTTCDAKLSCECGAYRARYGSLVFRGLYADEPTKPCQDRYGMVEVDGCPWFLVLDGHGPHGHACAQFCLEELPRSFDEAQGTVEERLVEASVKTNRALHKSTVESRDSGTTAVSLLVNDGVLYCSNVGDSRCILGRRENNSIKAIALSKDQTLYRQDERQRIEASGGRVLSIGQIEGSVPMDHVWKCELGDEIDCDGDPPRLWRKDAYEPGTAFSRSLGDFTAQELGCSSTPEIQEHVIDASDVCCVLATDGVWEFLTSQEVIDICVSCKTPKEACYRIVAESYRRWYEREERIDDIACCVLYFDGASSSGAVASPPPLRDAAPPPRLKRRGSIAPRASVSAAASESR
jgi:serine/threonine protein phosphatase PrpC